MPTRDRGLGDLRMKGRDELEHDARNYYAHFVFWRRAALVNLVWILLLLQLVLSIAALAYADPPRANIPGPFTPAERILILEERYLQLSRDVAEMREAHVWLGRLLYTNVAAVLASAATFFFTWKKR